MHDLRGVESAAGSQMKLAQIHDSEWVRPVHRGFIAECCSCGARHRMDFRVRKGAVEFRAERVRRRRKVMPL